MWGQPLRAHHGRPWWRAGRGWRRSGAIMSYRAWRGLLVRIGGQDNLARTDLLVLDIDGVLLDCSLSYPRAISAAAQRFAADLGWRMDGTLLTPEETRGWKRAGGFNDDWALTRAALHFFMSKGARGVAAARSAPPSQADFLGEVARLGGGPDAVRALLGQPPPAWDPERIARLCCSYYAGDRCREMFGFPAVEGAEGPGLCELERPLVAAARLLRWPGTVGIYTGRDDGETAFALQRLGLAGRLPPGRVVTSGSGMSKPDPAGLAALAQAAGDPAHGLYAGDNVDDQETVRRYRARRGKARPTTGFAFAGVLGGTLGDLAEAAFRSGGADIIAPGAADLVEVLLAIRGVA